MFNGLVAYLDSIKARGSRAAFALGRTLSSGAARLPGCTASSLAARGGPVLFLARSVNHLSRWLTGIEIHPVPRSSPPVYRSWLWRRHRRNRRDWRQCFDLSGRDVLGGTDPANGIGGKRHLTLCDDVIVGSGAQILGPVIVNSRARASAPMVVTKDAPKAR